MSRLRFYVFKDYPVSTTPSSKAISSTTAAHGQCPQIICLGSTRSVTLAADQWHRVAISLRAKSVLFSMLFCWWFAQSSPFLCLREVVYYVDSVDEHFTTKRGHHRSAVIPPFSLLVAAPCSLRDLGRYLLEFHHVAFALPRETLLR